MPDQLPNNLPQTPAEPSINKTGLDPNITAFISYVFLIVSGIIIYLLEKENQFVRFSAMQSVVFSLFLLAVSVIYGIAIYPLLVLAGSSALLLISATLSTVFLIGSLCIWVLLMYKAYNGQEWELPVIGKLARNFIK